MSQNDRPLMFPVEIKCSVMMPEPKPELRKAGASDHQCQTPPEYYMQTRLGGLPVRVYLCARHKIAADRQLAERRLAAGRKNFGSRSGL